MIPNFKFPSCQKVLPLVYDDSFSYYETICKVVDTLNQVIDKTNTLSDDFTALKSYVDNYFNNLDVTTEINNIMNRLINSGEFARIIANSTGIITPQLYGAKGDGKTDDTTAIQAAIDENPNSPIFFSGVYLISKTITLSTSNTSMLILGGSTIRATSNIVMIDFNREKSTTQTLPSEFYGIIGGVIDCNNIASIGIRNNNNRLLLMGVKVIDVLNIGIYDGSDTYTSIGQSFYSNVTLIQQRYSTDWSEGKSVGIYLNAQDCRLENVAILRMNKAIVVKKTGTIFTNLYLFADGNTTKYAGLDYGSYTSYGIYLDRDFKVNAPLNLTNVYFDTLDYSIYNNGTNSNWRLDIVNCFMYSSSVNFVTKRELYLKGGHSFELNITHLRMYDNSLTYFLEGVFTNTDDINEGYNRFDVVPNSNYWADSWNCLNNFGIKDAFANFNMEANTYYKIARLYSNRANGSGKWTFNVNLVGIEEIEFTAMSNGTELHIVNVKNITGNTLFEIHVDKNVETETLQNGQKMYYYTVYILSKAKRNIWLTMNGHGTRPYAKISYKPYNRALETGTPTNDAIINYGTGDRYYNLLNQGVSKTLQTNNINPKTYRLENHVCAANFTETIIIPNPTNTILRPFGLLNFFTSNNHVMIIDTAIDYNTNEVTIKIKNDTDNEITANIELVYIFFEFN